MLSIGPSWPTPNNPFPRMSRRLLLRTASGVLVVAHTSGIRLPRSAAADETGPSGLIVRSRRPLDLETPVNRLDSWLTPNEAFFVRSHFGEPARGLFPWKTEVRGLVSQSIDLTPEGWGGFEPHTVTAVLQCSGNGRAFFRPRMPGVPWEKGAVGNAEWTGVRLADVLQRAGLKPGAAQVHVLGGDGPPSPKTPPFFRSLPLEKALHPDTILATRMNGEPLPAAHGGPVRLVVPGWGGNHWMKWLRWITVSADEALGFYMQTGYRMPRVPAPPDAVLKPADLVPLTSMNVKSLITFPATGAKVPARQLEIRGVAWTGEGHVENVDVSVSGVNVGAWQAARMIDPARPWSWRRWSLTLEKLPAGRITIAVRATDSKGNVQPEQTPYNRSGYLWNGIDKVTCEVV